MKNFSIKSEKSLDFLIRDVKTTENKTFDVKDNTRQLNNHSKREYNSNGDRTLSMIFDQFSNLTLRQVSTFDDYGNKTGFINYDSNGYQDTAGKNELDDEGRMISKYYINQITETYKYNHNDEIIEVYYPNTGGRDIYEYDKSGFAIRQLSLSGGKSLFSLGTPKRKLTTFTNDEFGNIIEMKVYNDDNNELLFSQKNIMNISGDEIESIGYKSNNSVHSHVKYYYIYDNKGNWTLKQTMTQDAEIYREIERIISYYQ